MPPSQASPNAFSMLVPFVGMFAIFYFLVFRPQSQAQKTHKEMLKNLKKHDEVVTTGGIFGTIMNVKEDSLTLRVDENVRIEVEKQAIARLVKARGGEEVAMWEKKNA